MATALPFLPAGVVFDKFVEQASSNKLFLLCVVYAVVIPLYWKRGQNGGKDLAKRGAPTAPLLRGIMFVYNGLASLFSMWCFWNMVSVLKLSLIHI